VELQEDEDRPRGAGNQAQVPNRCELLASRALVVTDRALTLAPDNLRANYTKCAYLNLSHRASEALGVADAGLAVNPNLAPVYGARALAENSLGRFEQAESDARQAMRLSPRDLRMGNWHNQIGIAELEQGHFDATIDEFHKAVDAGYRAYLVYGNLAAAFAFDGKMDEAGPALAEARRLNPKFAIKYEMALAPNLPHMFEGLRKAGLSEE
jgi:tetratricopeptide (TPR) repeat protein